MMNSLYSLLPETTISKSAMNSLSNQERHSNVGSRRDLVNDLPCELLQEIFSIVVSTENDNEQDPRKRAGQSRLSMVCEHWQDLIEAYPTLWTDITITDFGPDHPVRYPSKVGTSPQSTFPKLARILSRSANCDIDVKIEIWSPPKVSRDSQGAAAAFRSQSRHRPFYFSSEHARFLSLLLSAHAHRIRTLDVITRDWTTHVDMFHAFINKPMPRLQDLRLRHETLDITNEGLTLMKYPSHPSLPLEQWHHVMYPSLRSFSVQEMPLGSLSFGGRIQNLHLVGPWRNLPTPSELRLVLSNLADTLEVLTLVRAVCKVGYGESPVPQKRLTLPHVHTFSLGYAQMIEEVELILQFLDIPAVRDLSIKDCRMGRLPPSEEAFTHIMKRLPLHQIVSLKLSNIRFEDREDYITMQDVFEGNFGAEDDLPIPLRFIRKLTAVKQLSVNSPCPIFMFFAAYPKTLRRDDKTRFDDARLINFRTVETMNIKADNWETRDWDPALRFLHNRFQWAEAQDGAYRGVVMNRLKIMLPYELWEEAQCIHPSLEEAMQNQYSQLAQYFDLEWVVDDYDVEEDGNVGEPW